MIKDRHVKKSDNPENGSRDVSKEKLQCYECRAYGHLAELGSRHKT